MKWFVRPLSALFVCFFANSSFADVILPQNMRGRLDAANCAVSAWACDADRLDINANIALYADGPAGTGKTLGVYAANIATTDPKDLTYMPGFCGNNAHRINFPGIPDWLRDGKSHTIYAYGFDVRPDGTQGGLIALDNSPLTTTITCARSADVTASSLNAALIKRASFNYVPTNKDSLSLFSSVTTADNYMLGTFKGNATYGAKLGVQLCGEYAANGSTNSFGYVSPNADAFTAIFDGPSTALKTAVLNENSSLTYTFALNGASGIMTTIDGLNPGRLPAAVARKIVKDGTIQMPQSPWHVALGCPVRAGDTLLAFEDTATGDSDFNDMVLIVREFIKASLTTLPVNDPALERRWQIANNNDTALDFYWEIGDLDTTTNQLKLPVKLVASSPIRVNAGQTVAFSTAAVSGDNYMVLYIKDDRFGNMRTAGLANPAQPNPMVLDVRVECQSAVPYSAATFRIKNNGGVGYNPLPYGLKNDAGSALASGQIPQLKPGAEISISYTPARPFSGGLKLDISGKGITSSVLYDACGVCGGNGSSCGQCTVGGVSGFLDKCGVCNGKNSCLDCKAVPFGGNTMDKNGACCLPGEMDQCGVCGGNNACLDCMGTPNGTAKKDSNGICCPLAAIDSCSICGGNDASRGCDGVCGSKKVVDSFGVCGGANAASTCTLVTHTAAQRKTGLSLVSKAEVALNDVRRFTASAISCNKKNRKNDLKKAEKLASQIRAGADVLYLKDGRICSTATYSARSLSTMLKTLNKYREGALRMVRSSCKVTRCECQSTRTCKKQ